MADVALINSFPAPNLPSFQLRRSQNLPKTYYLLAILEGKAGNALRHRVLGTKDSGTDFLMNLVGRAAVLEPTFARGRPGMAGIVVELR